MAPFLRLAPLTAGHHGCRRGTLDPIEGSMRHLYIPIASLVSLGCHADPGATAADTSTSTASDTDAVSSTTAPSPSSSGVDSSGGAPEGPTYAEDVAPILATHCWSCHLEGGIAPFSLREYDAVKPLDLAIVAVTSSRSMPPWPLDGSGACGSFVDQRWLTDDELATLAAWVDAGSPPGDLSLVPPPPDEPPHLDEVSVTLAVEPYTPQASSPDNPLDDYRCFVVDPQLAADSVLTALEVHPGVAAQTHHIVLFALGSDAAEAEAVAQSGADGRPGYTCFGGANVPDSTIAGAWAPGVPIMRFPAGTGAAVPAGRLMVLQMHYNLASGAELDTTTVDLQFDDTAIGLRQVVVIDSDLAIPPNTTDHVEQASTVLDEAPVEIVAAFPHMHTLGQQLRVEVEGACAIDVPRWDFHWQQLYGFSEPLIVPGGANVTIGCIYDSTGRDSVTTFGEGTSDEMCVALFFALP
jgi:hypothetical protein